MPKRSHDALVRDQFDPRAQAYLDSPVHAQGPDLEELTRIIGNRPTARVADLGCGGGHVSFALAPLVQRVTAFDLSESMLAIVAAEATRRGIGNLDVQQGSVEQIAIPDATFDVVVSRFSAHHWLDVKAALAEVRRILKPGGTAVFMDVVAPESPLLDTWLQTLELLRDPSHVRDYSVTEWRTMLTAVGLPPHAVSTFRLRLDFAPWIARMAPVESHVLAIRSLQACAAADVVRHFAIEADGSFMLDTALIAVEG